MSKVGNDTIAKFGTSWILLLWEIDECNGGKLVLPIVNITALRNRWM